MRQERLITQPHVSGPRQSKLLHVISQCLPAADYAWGEGTPECTLAISVAFRFASRGFVSPALCAPLPASYVQLSGGMGGL